MSRTGLLVTIALSLALSLAQYCALAGSLPGQDINSSASITWCAQTQLSTAADVSYMDATGATIEQSADQPACVEVETTVSPVISQPARSFVAPDTNAPIYFTISRSFYSGASLQGKSVKLVGRLRTIDGVQYLDDGAKVTLSDSTTGRKTTFSSQVPVLHDLLTAVPADGGLVIVQGVCRIEPDGSPSLLPFGDSAISAVQ